MATIGKIREKSSWVIGLIGLAMLGFIATDLLSNKLFSRGSNTPKGVGRIYGEDIDQATFKEKLDPALKNQLQQKKGGELSAAEISQTNDQIWNELVEQTVLDRETKALGLDVTGEEIYDLCIGPNPDQLALQYLADPKTKQLNRQGIKQFIQNIDNAKPDQQEFWHSFETYLVNERLKNKYKTIVKVGLYYNDLEMEDEYISQNKTSSIQYVPLFLNSIPDSTITISDNELKDYFDKHKEDYKREDSRTFEYVAFDVRPSKEDTLNTLKAIMALKQAFKDTKDDSSFVVANGKGGYTNQYQGRGSFGENSYLTKNEDSLFIYKKDSDLMGPYYEDGSYKIAKIVAHKDDSVYYMRASHILIKYKDGAPDKKADSMEAYEKAKKLYEEVLKGGDFAKIATEKSEDGSASKGGDLGWFKEGAMVVPFNNAVKNHKKGDIILVSTQFGVHVIKVTADKTKKVIKVAVLDKPVSVGSETNSKAYAQVNSFRTKAVDAKTFDEASKNLNLNKRVAENIKPNQHDITGLENPKELIKWAFKDDLKEGDISDPLRIGDKFVVAKMAHIYIDGYAPFEDVKKDLKSLAQHEKKKQILADKLKAALDKSKSLEAIAKDVKSTVSSADGITFQNPNIPNLANEPMVVGAVAGLKLNEVSQPIKGESGVFIVKVTNVNAIRPPTNYDKDRATKIKQTRDQSDNEAKEALKKQADVKDYRYIYY